MILVVNFNLVENALLEKVTNELGIGERCRYLQSPALTPKTLSEDMQLPDNALPRVIIINLDSMEADWKTLLSNLKNDDVWSYIPVLGFGFLDDPTDVAKFYELGGASCIRKPHGYDGLAKITRTAMGYWLDVSFLPCDFLNDVA